MTFSLYIDRLEIGIIPKAYAKGRDATHESPYEASEAEYDLCLIGSDGNEIELPENVQEEMANTYGSEIIDVLDEEIGA